jgi:hypothetical protein
MACKTILIAGVFYSVGCNAPAGTTGEIIVEAPPAIEQTAVAENVPRGRRTGLTLKDVSKNLEWRERTFNLMVSF